MNEMRTDDPNKCRHGYDKRMVHCAECEDPASDCGKGVRNMTVAGSSDYCTWTRLPDVAHPFETRPVRFKASCTAEIAGGVHPFYPDNCPVCARPIRVETAMGTKLTVTSNEHISDERLVELLGYARDAHDSFGSTDWRDTASALRELVRRRAPETLQPASKNDIPLRLSCRFGCEEDALYLIEFHRGCVCYPDHIQALCAQHWQTAEPLQGARVIMRLAPRSETPPASKSRVSDDDLEYMLTYWRGCKDHIVELSDTTTAERTMAGNFLSALVELKESRTETETLRQELREVTQRHQLAWDLKNKHLNEIENEVTEAHDVISAFDSEIASGNVPDRLGDLLEKLRPTAHETCDVGWQPIASVPKTGAFLVSIDTIPDLAWPAYQTDGCGVHSNAHGILNKQNHYGVTLRASYWMPMPTAPVLKANAPLCSCGHDGPVGPGHQTNCAQYRERAQKTNEVREWHFGCDGPLFTRSSVGKPQNEEV